MQVILLRKIAGLGGLGDQVNVKAGYARNDLIPKKKAVLATKQNIDFFESQRIALEKKMANDLILANSRAKKINELGNITISAKASKDGKLFGSIGIRDIIDVISSTGIEVSKREVHLPNGVFRSTGKYEVGFQFHSEVCTKLILHIIAE